MKRLEKNLNIINDEINSFKKSMHYSNNHFKKKDLIDVNENKPNADSKALVVVKDNALLDFNSKTKKFANFSLKSILLSLAISFINLFI